MEAKPCSFWMVQRYTPQSTGDACTMAKAAGPSSPALQRGDTLPVKAVISAEPGPERGLEAPQSRLAEAAGSPGAGSKAKSWCWTTQVWFTVLTLSSYVTLGKGRNTSEPRFPPVYREML